MMFLNGSAPCFGLGFGQRKSYPDWVLLRTIKAKVALYEPSFNFWIPAKNVRE